MSDFHRMGYRRDVNNRPLEQAALPSRLKHLVAGLFRLDIADPDSIPDNVPLLGGSLGLDSLDGLELAMCIEEEFGLTIHSREESHHAFASISSLANFIHARTQSSPVRQPVQTGALIPNQQLTGMLPV